MGRGASKIGDTSKTGAKAKKAEVNVNTGKAQQTAAQKLYDNPKTMAFPSSDAVIKRVLALQSMKENMASAPVGTTVMGNFGNRGAGKTVRMFEKTSETTWSATDITKNSDGEFRTSGVSKFRGRKALEQMQHILNDGVNTNIEDGFIREYRRK